MLADHSIHFYIGSAMMKRQELMRNPRKVIIYLRHPLAIILQIEDGSGRLNGSNAPDKVLKMMNRDIITAWPALDTIITLIGESITAVAPSSMYPSAPTLQCGEIFMSASSTATNVTPSSSLRGLVSCCEYGEGKTSGYHISQ